MLDISDTQEIVRTFGHSCEQKFPIYGTVRETCVPLVSSIGKTALRVCRRNVEHPCLESSLIELRGKRAVSACHFICKLKHLTPGRGNKGIITFTLHPLRSCKGYLGDCFGKAYRAYPGVYLSAETTHRRVRCRSSRYSRS